MGSEKLAEVLREVNSLELFVDALDDDGRYKLSGVQDDTFILDKADISGGHEQVSIPMGEVFRTVKDSESAAEVVNVVAGDREGEILEGQSRIVGYFSKVRNWNKSKLGELSDRQRGVGAYSVNKPIETGA